ncbi:hypothetical protein GCM10027062_08460 [Nocardioides hungaricus]
MHLQLAALLAAVLLPAAATAAPPPAPCSRGLVALTFDDGPLATVTPRLVRLLKRLEVPATFFMVGGRAAADPELVRLVDRAGFPIGNHTWAHTDLTSQKPAQARRALLATRRALRDAGVAPTDLARPPYGAVDDAVRRLIGSTGLVPVLWTIDSRDWTGLSPREIEQRIVSAVRPRATNVVLGGHRAPATASLGPVAHVREAALGATGRQPLPVVDHQEPDAVRRVQLHEAGGRAGVTSGVRERLAQHGEYVGRQVRIDGGSHRAAEPERGAELQGAGRPLDDLGDRELDVGVVLGRAEVEDRAPDVPDGAVQLVDRRLEPGRRLGALGLHGEALQAQPDREEPLDHEVVQVPPDPLVVLDEDQSLLVPARLTDLERQGRLLGEPHRQVRVDRSGCRRALSQPGEGEHAGDPGRGAQRHQDGRPQRRPSQRLGQVQRTGIRGEVLDRRGEPAADHLAGQRPAEVEAGQVLGAGRPARHGADGQAVGAGPHDHPGGVGPGQVAGAVGHDLEQLVAHRGREQSRRHLRRGGQPPHLPGGLLVETRVLDGDAGRGGQRHDDALVLVGEGTVAALLGQVEIAEHLVPDPHGDAEERAHRRMVRREAVRGGVRRDVGQAHGLGTVDEVAEQAEAPGQLADPLDLVG